MTIRGSAKEIAALVVALQERQRSTILIDDKVVAQVILDKGVREMAKRDIITSMRLEGWQEYVMNVEQIKSALDGLCTSLAQVNAEMEKFGALLCRTPNMKDGG